MVSEKNIKEKILDMIKNLKEKNLLVEVKFPKEKRKFNVYRSNELNCLSYKVTYVPKNFVIKEDNSYIKDFHRYLSALDSKSDKIDYLLKDLDPIANVVLENVECNSYFHFTENEVIINLDNFTYSLDKFKEILAVYNKNPKTFLRNIVNFNLSYDFNDLVKNSKMRYFKSTIYNVKLQGKKYIVFNTSDSFEKIMYILNENNEYLDITDEKYIKILKKLSLIVGL